MVQDVERDGPDGLPLVWHVGCETHPDPFVKLSAADRQKCNPDSGSWMCGTDIAAIRGCRVCDGLAEYLCDYPMGEGKTCDLDLCRIHAVKQPGGFPLDFCPAHSLIERLNSPQSNTRRANRIDGRLPENVRKLAVDNRAGRA